MAEPTPLFAANFSMMGVSVCYTYAIESGYGACCSVYVQCPRSRVGNKRHGQNEEGTENMNNTNEITFTAELIKRLVVATTTASVAVGEAALSAIAQDKRVTVRTFASALRGVAPMLGTSNGVLAAAIKAAKIDRATLEDVTAAMARAADKKRADDARRAAEKREAAPGKALQKALSEVEECKKAMRSPLEKAKDELTAATAAVEAAAQVLKEARAAQREAKDNLDALLKGEQGEGEEGNG